MSFITTSELGADEAARKARHAATEERASIEFNGRHGTYRTTPDGLDAAIAAYLPNSPGGLRAIAEERAGHDFPGVYTVSAFLVILADFDS